MQRAASRATANAVATLLAVSGVCGRAAAGVGDMDWLEQYNVVWTTQSRNSGGSMPVSGGDIMSDSPVAAEATYESWRTEDIELPNDRSKHDRRAMCMINYDAYPGKVLLYRDEIRADQDLVRFHHRVDNTKDSFEFEHRSWHCPEMYPLFPYELYGVGMPNLELMKHTSLATGSDRYKTTAWEQANIHAARLGDVALAQRLNAKKMDNGPYRFPAFWPHTIDWAPDHNWGGSGMIGMRFWMRTKD